MLRKKKKAFTLAEILITLTIVGIVAALTIPSFITNMQNNRWKSAYKKNYALLSQATMQISNDNGGTMVNAFEAIPFDGWSDQDKVPDTYAKYMTIIKKCRAWESKGNCFPQSWSYLNGETADNDHGLAAAAFLGMNSGFSGALLNNGASLGFAYSGASCGDNSWVLGNVCGYIMVDVNGFATPNVWGKDIYGFFILKDGTIKPFGTSDDEISGSHSITCIQGSSDANNLGLNCGYLYMTGST